jgi:tetratricopeptide (TPR) repeat protein
MSKRPSSPERAGVGHPALERAILALQMGRPDEAERLASEVLKANRGNIAAAQILGRALLIQNRIAEAIIPLEKAARRSEDPVIESLLGSALASTGRSAEAIEQLRLAISRRPPYPPAFAELGGQLSKLGRIEESFAVFESGLALTPGVTDLVMGLGHLHLKTNDRAKARSLFLQVQAIEPKRLDALSALANVLALDGEYAAAADLYRRVLALRPDDAVMRYNLGKCLLELGDRDAGEATLRTAASGGLQMTGGAITALSAASHGRFFLRPSAIAKFLGVKSA